MANYNNMSYKVCIRCMTYNQSAYITDAMDGFAMQQTNFPFLAVIVDDASTDGEQKVIKAYVKEHFDHSGETGYKEWETEDAFWSFAWHVENKNCNFVVVLLKQNLFGNPKKGELIREWCDAKYVALCEGDDYWIDPLKLQKQVDFLEEHENYSMCFHNVKVLGGENERWYFDRLKEGDYTDRDIYENWLVSTCSVVYRKGKAFESKPFIIHGDIFLFLQLSERGKMYCMGFVGSVYRRHSGSASCGYSEHTSVKLFAQYKYMEKRFPKLKDISKRSQERALKHIIYAPYFPGIWKYRVIYMFRHPKLIFSSFLSTTILSYTPIRNHKFWKKH